MNPSEKISASLQPKVCAGVIAYDPDMNSLHNLLKTLEVESDQLVLIDNCSCNSLGILDLLKTSFPLAAGIFNAENLGIASAINQIAGYAMVRNYDFIWLFDQDSTPESGLRNKLILAYQHLQKKGRRIAALGPCLVDIRSGERTPFVKFCLPFNKHLLDNINEPYVSCDFLISSGCLISIQALRAIGLMEDALFIDNVDMEWSLRARSKKFELFGVKDALMKHCIGDQQVYIPILKQYIRFHAPMRMYFMARNRTLLYKRNYIPLAWKVHDFKRFVAKLIILFIIGPNRKEYFTHLKRGIFDALKYSGANPKQREL